MIRNVHQRTYPVSPAQVGAVLDTLAGPHDELWITDLIEPMVLDAGLRPGSAGGHGPVRYHVTHYRPGRLVRFEFDPSVGLVGTHEFEVLGKEGTASVTLRHTLLARTQGAGRLLWPVLIRRMHDGAVEDMLDQLEVRWAGQAHRQVPTPRWVRALGRVVRMRKVAQGAVVPGPLLRAAMSRGHAADCWATPLLPHDSRDPVDWARAVLGRQVPGVSWLMGIRDVIARRLGLRTVPPHPPATGFPLLASSGTEALLGVDDSHLSFRLGITVVAGAAGEGEVRFITSTRLHNTLGRAYWGVVRHFHPLVMRTILRTTPVPVPPSPRG